MIKKLTRSRTNKVFSGVLGGIGEYFNINPNFLRILYVILAINSFITMLALYIASSLIIPENGSEVYKKSSYNTNNSIFLGIILIIIGVLLLINTILPIYFPELLYEIKYYITKVSDFWPILLIILGVYLLFNRDKE